MSDTFLEKNRSTRCYHNVCHPKISPEKDRKKCNRNKTAKYLRNAQKIKILKKTYSKYFKNTQNTELFPKKIFRSRFKQIREAKEDTKAQKK